MVTGYVVIPLIATMSALETKGARFFPKAGENPHRCSIRVLVQTGRSGLFTVIRSGSGLTQQAVMPGKWLPKEVSKAWPDWTTPPKWLSGERCVVTKSKFTFWNSLFGSNQHVIAYTWYQSLLDSRVRRKGHIPVLPNYHGCLFWIQDDGKKTKAFGYMVGIKYRWFFSNDDAICFLLSAGYLSDFCILHCWKSEVFFG